MAKWEYKVTSRDQDSLLTEEQLNVLGEAGLELVTVATAPFEEIEVGRRVQRVRFFYFFKRPLAVAKSGK